MKRVRIYTKLVVIGVALFFILRYVGFSDSQTWLLVIVFLLIYEAYVDLSARMQWRDTFTPFWVRVSPNWYDLLRDHGIIQSNEETFGDDAELAWRQLLERGEVGSSDNYRVLRESIVFTVLNSTPHGSLVYWNSRRTFRNEIDLEEGIREIKIARPTLRALAWSPDVYVKWGIDGYELGLEVNGEWWENTCAGDETKQLSQIRTHPEHLTGTVRLVVATLPYSEFHMYRGSNALAPTLKVLQRAAKKRGDELARAGWKLEEKDAELDLLGAPDCVEHKYFKIEHRAL